MNNGQQTVMDFFAAGGEKIYMLVGRDELGLTTFLKELLPQAAAAAHTLPLVYEIWEGENSRHFLYRWLSETANGQAALQQDAWKELLARDPALNYQLQTLLVQDIRPLEIRFLDAVRFVSRVLEAEERLLLCIVPRTELRERVFADFIQAVLQVLPVRVKMLVCQAEGDVLARQADFSPSNRYLVPPADPERTASLRAAWEAAVGRGDLQGTVLHLLAYLVHPVEAELLVTLVGEATETADVAAVLQTAATLGLVEHRSTGSRLAYPRLCAMPAPLAPQRAAAVDRQAAAFYGTRIRSETAVPADVLYHSLSLTRMEDKAAIVQEALASWRAKLTHGGSDLCEYELGRALELSGEGDPQRGHLLLALGEIQASRQRYDEALATLDQAIALLREQHSPELIAALEQKATAAFGKRDTETAKAAFTAALELVRGTGNPAVEADLTSQLAYVHYSLSDFPEARRLYEASRDLYANMSGDAAAAGRRGEAQQWANLGHTSYAEGKFVRAEECHTRALDIYEILGDRSAAARQQGYRGHAFFAAQAFDRAMEAYRASAQAHEQLGEQLKAAHRYGSMGYTRYSQRRLDEARDYFQEALDRYRQLGSVEGEAAQIANLGLTSGDKGDFDEAAASFTQAAAMYRELGDPLAEATQIVRLGHVRRAQKNYEEAEKLYTQARQRYHALEYALGESDVEVDLGKMFAEMEQWQKAIDCFRRARESYATIGNQEKETMTLLLIAQVESALEQPEDACKTLEHALQLFREGGNDLGAAAVLTQLGLIRHDQKNYEQAKELYEEARTLYAKTPDREGEANTLANLGTLYYQTGKLVEAVDAYDRALDLLRPLGHAAAIASVLLNQSYALAGQQKYSEASACLKEVQQIGAQAAGLVDEGVIVQRLAELERQASESLARMRQELLADREPKAKTAAGKVGRNELCPCGSGKKYKKCCGAEA